MSAISENLRSQGQGKQVDLRERLKQSSTEVLLRSLDTPRGHQLIQATMHRIYEYMPGRLFNWYGTEHLAQIKTARAKNHKIALIANHKNHGDSVIMARAVRKVNDAQSDNPFADNVYTLAGSMASGDQGPFVKMLYVYGALPFFLENGITPDSVVSNNDVKERHMTKPEDNGKLTGEALQDPNILSIVHPEGKTKGGKIDPTTGEEFGVQQMDKGFRGMLAQQLDLGIPTLLVPFYIDGLGQTFSPKSKNFTLHGVNELAKMLMFGEGTKVGQLRDAIFKFWFGSAERDKPGTVIIGEPEYLSDLYKSVLEGPHNVMWMLAKHSPRHSGEYERQLAQGIRRIKTVR